MMYIKSFIEKDDFLVSDTGGLEKNPSSPNRSRSYDLLFTTPDALPLSYRRLVVAKAIKQFSGGVKHHQPSKPLMAYDNWWQVSVGFQDANRLWQFWRTEEWRWGKVTKLKSNKVLWKMFKECGVYKQKGCKVLHTLCCTRSTVLISFTWNILSALSLNIESTGESTGVCLVNLLSNWLTSSSPVCVQEQQQN